MSSVARTSSVAIVAGALFFSPSRAGAQAPSEQPTSAKDVPWFDESNSPPPADQPAPYEPPAPVEPPQPPAPEAAQPAPPTSETVPYDRDPSALTDFRAELDPYGRWVDLPTYGTVWVPYPSAVGSDFVPYQTAGHWALDPYGRWLWVSDYPWGAIAFHYGRWLFVPGVGWAWVPGRAYAPAWVAWSVTPDADYVGWTPAPPAWFWYGGIAYDVTVPLTTYYCYAPRRYIFYDHVRRYVIRDPTRARYIAARARPIEIQRSRYVPVGPSWRRLGIPESVARTAVRRPSERSLAYARPPAWTTRRPTPAARGYAPRAAEPLRAPPARSAEQPLRAPPARRAEQPLRPPQRAMPPPRSAAPAIQIAPRAPAPRAVAPQAPVPRPMPRPAPVLPPTRPAAPMVRPIAPPRIEAPPAPPIRAPAAPRGSRGRR